MSALDRLIKKFDDRSAVIGVVGLGYVGLPVAAAFADAGFKVIGIDVDRDRIDQVNSGRSPIEGSEPGLEELLSAVVERESLEAGDDYSLLSQADTITINVQTPVGGDNAPDYTALESALDSLSVNMKRGSLVIVESTVSPGTTMGLVQARLESGSGLTEGIDFFLGVCPERVMPGKLLANLRSVSRVCGGSTPAVATAMTHLYRTIVQGDLDIASATIAELVKVTENTYRDVQIAFANEIALICRDLGEDVWTVRDLVNKVPQRDLHLPGGGVGGHCIPKDPWLLAHAATTDLRLIPSARAVNDGMPLEIARLVGAAADRLVGAGQQPDKARRVLILGYSYLPESDDTRNSPSAVLASELERLGLEVLVHDPYVPAFQGNPAEMLEGCGIAVTMVAHRLYDDLPMRGPVHIDARRLAEAVEAIDKITEATNA